MGVTAGRILVLAVVLMLVSMGAGGAAILQEDHAETENPQAESKPADDARPGKPTDEGAAEQIQPLDLGLREEAGVRLLILDVKVRDKKGRPVRGLTLDDFEVVIGGRTWPLVAVDDFCNCESDAGMNPSRSVRVESVNENGAPTASDAESPDRPGETLPQHFVIYLDFSELQQGGRMAALGLAHRWIEEGMQPGDRVMIAGYSSAAGLVEITPFTTDRAVLFQGLQAAATDRDFVEPFADRLSQRLDACGGCANFCPGGTPEECFTLCCSGDTNREANHGGRSLEALDLFIGTLEGISGRKQILLFNQNNRVAPANPYMETLRIPLSRKVAFRATGGWSTPKLMKRIESVAATAAANRTTINVATMTGDDDVENLGSNFADLTGGVASGYGHSPASILMRAGRECCMYRLSVQVPEDPPRRTLPAKVYVRARPLNLSYRVRFYSPQERWFRKAQLALLTTSRSPDAELQLALLPRGRRDKRWSVEVQVAFALKDLQMVPRLAERTGRWRVGALLNREDGKGAWEMLTLAQATFKGTGTTTLEALHSRRVDNLKPGDYRLRAFVEDAELNRFWSREVSLILPAAGRKDDDGVWLSSPHLAQLVDNRLDLDLAPVTKKTPVTSVVGAPAAGFVPVNDDHVEVGSMLKLRTLLCPGPDQNAPPIVSILLKDGQPLVRLPAAVMEDAGECVALTDTVDTAVLGPGDYVYRLMLTQSEGAEPLLREVELTVRDAPGF